MTTHFLSTMKNNCRQVDNPMARTTSDPRAVTCAVCLAAIRAFQRGADETVKDAVAVKRSDASAITARMRVVMP